MNLWVFQVIFVKTFLKIIENMIITFENFCTIYDYTIFLWKINYNTIFHILLLKQNFMPNPFKNYYIYIFLENTLNII